MRPDESTVVKQISLSDLDGRVALVTGAGQEDGIGLAAAVRLAELGAAVVISDLTGSPERERELIAAAARVAAAGGRVEHIAMDVTDRAQIRRGVAFTVEAFGRLDILFNNAGTASGCGPFLDIPESEWDLCYHVNQKSIINLCREVIPIMQKQRSGSIINNASLAGLGVVPMMAGYSASKSAVIGLTKSIAAEFGEDGIRCNAVCPGLINTQMGRQNIDFFQTDGMSYDDSRQALAGQVPLREWGTPAQVADVVCFLAGTQSAYVTGVALPVAGGLPAGL